MWGVIVVCILFYSSGAVSIAKDGDFETFGPWQFSPLSLWCDQYCVRPSQWNTGAFQGHSYVLAVPSETASIVQHYNSTALGELYDACTLTFYLRAVDTPNTDFSIVWKSVRYAVDWFDYLNSANYSTGDWVQMTIELADVSDTLQFSITTGASSWVSIDTVNLDCYQSSWFANASSLKILLIIVGFLVLFAGIRFLYWKSPLIRAVLRCRCCRRQDKFIELTGDDIQFDRPEKELREVPQFQPLNPPPQSESISSDEILDGAVSTLKTALKEGDV